jgi:hypothetical protein
MKSDIPVFFEKSIENIRVSLEIWKEKRAVYMSTYACL